VAFVQTLICRALLSLIPTYTFSLQREPLVSTIDYICILDFEATCDSTRKPHPQEIIEFPTILFNLATRTIEKTFHHYIRPDINPTLSEFCKDLTGINQRQVDEGISLKEALSLHQRWLKECGVIPWTPDCQPSKEQKTFLYLTVGD
jgi:inhibitor of KinA sporulation pathway (predicted exonuclease)